MAAKKTPQKQSKSAFIHSLSSSTPAVDVIAKGKAAGLKLSKNYVYKVRTEINAKSPAKGASMTTKPVAAVTKVSKADFVRAHAGLAPKDVVAKAKAEGVKFNTHYVYRVRGYDKTAGKTKVTKATTPATKPSAPTIKQTPKSTTVRKAAPVPRPIPTTSSAETLLKAVAAELGLGHAMEILAGERARVRAVIGR
jgi:hypothetical protein